MSNKTPKIRFAEFSDNWEVRKLGEVADVRDGTHRSPVYQQKGHPFITSKNVKNGYINYDDIQYISDDDFEEINRRSKVDINDILMGMIGTIGNLAFIRTEPDFAIKNVALIKDKKQISSLFLYHNLQSNFIETQLLSGLDGGTQKFFALNKIRELDITVPQPNEQQRIGEYFSRLDDLIGLYKRKLEKSLNLKKAMLEKMFPQNDKPTPQIRFAGFNDNWEVRKLGDLAEIGDIDHRMPETVDNGIPYLMTGDFININELNFSGVKHISLEDYKKLSSKIKPEKHDILFARYATIGAVRYVDFMGDFLISYSCAIIKNSKKIYSKYLYHFLTSDMAQGQIQLEVNTGSQGNIGIETMKNNINVSFPTHAEQQRIGEYFSRLDDLIGLYKRKLEKSLSLKKAMLEKMFP